MSHRGNFNKTHLSLRASTDCAAIAFVVSFSHQKRDKLPFDVADGSLRSRGQEVTDCSVEIELHRGRVCLGGGGHVSSSRRGRYVVTVYCRYEKTSNGDRFELGIGVSGGCR